MTKHDEAKKILKPLHKSIYYILLVKFFDNYINEAEATEKELKELKKREVPMRADNDENYHYFTCPKCGVDWGYSTIPDEHNYCGNCGQKLDWSEKK